MTGNQIIKKLEKAGIDTTHIESRAREIEIYVEDADGNCDYDKTDALKDKVMSVGLDLGGFTTGYGAWVLSKGYEVNTYDYCDPSNPIHY